MGFIGGPLDGQPVSPETLGAADEGGMVDLESLLAGMPSAGAGAGAAPVEPPMMPPPSSAAPGGGGQPLPPLAKASAEDGGSEREQIGSVLSSLAALSTGGTLSERSKLAAQKAMTLLQQIAAEEEREELDAMGGKLSPRLLTKAYGG